MLAWLKSLFTPPHYHSWTFSFGGHDHLNEAEYVDGVCVGCGSSRHWRRDIAQWLALQDNGGYLEVPYEFCRHLDKACREDSASRRFKGDK